MLLSIIKSSNYCYFKQFIKGRPNLIVYKLTNCNSQIRKIRSQNQKNHTIFPNIVLTFQWLKNRFFKYVLNRVNVNKFRMMPSNIMEAVNLSPPDSIRGMKTLHTDQIKKTINIPVLIVGIKDMPQVMKCFRKHILKFNNFLSVKCENDDPSSKVIYLNPNSYINEKDINSLCKESGCESIVKIDQRDVQLKYENWNAENILTSILPKEHPFGGFSVIGHILHLNLKDHHEPFKFIIGQVLLDKIKYIKLVVNKTDTIDNTFRTFKMEVLAGEGGTVTTLIENRCSFELDFAKVYWNSRLSTEHQLIIDKVTNVDVLYDVMAGIGPFSIPAAKKRCRVLANDLNPHSYEYLLKNCKKNKVTDKVDCYNLDAEDFIRTILKDDLLHRWNDECFSGNIHVTMNLPAKAVEFLPLFIGLIKDEAINKEVTVKQASIPLPLLHIYLFTMDPEPNLAVNIVAEHLGGEQMKTKLSKFYSWESKNEDSSNHRTWLWKFVEEVSDIRKVSRVKVMMRVSVRLPFELLSDGYNLADCQEHDIVPCKKIKLSQEEAVIS